MEDGLDRARRTTGRSPSGPRRRQALPESVEDVLALHGLLPPAPAAPAGGRAARRRAAEEKDSAAGATQSPGAGRRPAPQQVPHRAPRASRARAARARVPSAAGRLVVAVLAAFVVATTSLGWAAKGWLGSAVRDASALERGSVPASNVDQNILIVTIDSAAAPGTRTADTVVIAHVPAGGGPVAALSIPVDLEINRPPCERFDPGSVTYTGATVPAEARTRVDSAAGVGGPRCITRVVQQLTGLEITGYVGMDLAGVGAVVDAVSGVAVCVPRPVVDGDLGPILPVAGPGTLDGRLASDFVRATTVAGEPSPEHGLIERQQQVVASVLGAALSSTGLLDVGQLAALRPALGATFVSDTAGLDRMLAVSLTLRRLDAPGVRFAALPVEQQSNGRGNTVLRATDAAALFAALRENTPLPDGADDQRADVGPAPADVTVQVLNASERPGLAAEVGAALTAIGFGVGEVGNAERPSPQAVIRFSPDQAAAAALLAVSIPSATPVPDPDASGVLQLMLGSSFDGIVRPPTAESTTKPAVSGTLVTACP